jgi:hypothetical protein
MEINASFLMERARRVVPFWPTPMPFEISTTPAEMWVVISSGFHQLFAVALLLAMLAYFFFRPILKAIMR